jgi:CTP:phosphocholine cytidylyltransferase-like protein
MKILRVVAILLFVVTTALYVYFSVTEKLKTDNTVPVITLEEDVLEVGINATNAELLKGVTAFDEKDGDITDRVIVESLSNFIEPGLCRITYAVCDSNNHVATAT